MSTVYIDHLPAGFVFPGDDTGKRLLREYGAIFVARGVTVPRTVIFKGQEELAAWHSTLAVSQEEIGGITIELQSPAMTALRAAVNEAKQKGSSITPRGTDAARRDYVQTEELWASRVLPGLEHWVGKGRLGRDEADAIRALAPVDQVPKIFALEEQGMYFSKDLSKPIIYSVAPPGASQHLSMLALDVAEYDEAPVRAILSRHGWFQTVISDLPHFTYLGLQENELPAAGLKKTSRGGHSFWVPE